MAGRGPAPKPPEVRRNTSAPRAGEWLDLPELAAPVLPDLPEFDWSSRTVSAWAAWRSDPVTSQYGPADVQMAIDLAYIYEGWVRKPTSLLAGEIRQRQDSLGLSPKGRQDRRWRIKPAGEVVEMPKRQSAAERMERLKARAAAASSDAS